MTCVWGIVFLAVALFGGAPVIEFWNGWGLALALAVVFDLTS